MANDVSNGTASAKNKITVVLGAQWGDEGKGKLVDLVAKDFDVVARCQVRFARRGFAFPLFFMDPNPDPESTED